MQNFTFCQQALVFSQEFRIYFFSSTVGEFQQFQGQVIYLDWNEIHVSKIGIQLLTSQSHHIIILLYEKQKNFKASFCYLENPMAWIAADLYAAQTGGVIFHSFLGEGAAS